MKNEDTDDILGKTIDSVYLSSDKENFIIRFSDGFEAKFATMADCCSRSWIEEFEVYITELKGSLLVDVKDSDTVKHEYHPEHDCLQVYRTIFSTDRGDIVLEYRNSSNGYYGGWLMRVY